MWRPKRRLCQRVPPVPWLGCLSPVALRLQLRAAWRFSSPPELGWVPERGGDGWGGEPCAGWGPCSARRGGEGSVQPWLTVSRPGTTSTGVVFDQGNGRDRLDGVWKEQKYFFSGGGGGLARSSAAPWRVGAGRRCGMGCCPLVFQSRREAGMSRHVLRWGSRLPLFLAGGVLKKTQSENVAKSYTVKPVCM